MFKVTRTPEKIMKTSIGDVLLYASGQNPYLYQGEYRSGPARAEALRQFRDSGALPAGIAAWSASEHRDIQRQEIDWSGMRS